jgi:hypothetical protein
MNCSAPTAAKADYEVYLDYGADSFFGHFGQLSLTETGIRFKSRWRFSLGTQLAVRLCIESRAASEPRVCEEVTGFVVSCDPCLDDPTWYEMVVLFLDLPTTVRQEFGRLAVRPELRGNLS